MFRIFRSYTPFSVIALLLVAILAKLFWLTHPSAAIVLSNEKLWGEIVDGLHFVVGKSPVFMTFLATINLTGQAIYINRIAMENHLFSTRNYLPALCFILLSSLVPSWNYLSASIVATWFLLGALDNLLNLRNNAHVGKSIFNIGLAIGCAFLLSPSFIVFIPLIFLALSVQRAPRLTEWILGFVGFLTPFYFLIAGIFLFGHLSDYSKWLPNGIHFIDRISVLSTKFWLVIAVLSLLIIAGFSFLNIQFEHMLTQVRKRWSIIISGLFLAVIPILFQGMDSMSRALPAIFFSGLIIANIWSEQKRKWIGRILFYLLLAVLIFAEWIVIP